MLANRMMMAAAVVDEGVDFLYGATATANNETEGAASNAFDADNDTYWYSFNASSPHWVKAQLSSAKTGTRYRLRIYSVTDYAPLSWTILGSNNDSDWDTLDTITSHSWSSIEEAFNFSNSTSYLYYKINITDGSHNNQMILREWKMYE